MSMIPVLNILGNNINLKAFTAVSSDDDDDKNPEWPEHFARQALDMYGFSPEAEEALLERLDFSGKCRVFLLIIHVIQRIVSNQPAVLPPAALLHMRAYIVFAHKLLNLAYPTPTTPKSKFEEFNETIAEWIEEFNDAVEMYFSSNKHGMCAFLYDYAREVHPTITVTFKRPIWNGN